MKVGDLSWQELFNSPDDYYDCPYDAEWPDYLEKGIKEGLIGASLLATSPSLAEDTKKHTTESVFEYVSKKNPILGAIAMQESSGGKNLKHETVKDPSSIHHGHTAGGMFGMMPHAAAFVFKNNKKLSDKYPEYAKMSKDVDNNHYSITKALNANPKMAADLAEALFDHNKRKSKTNDMLIHSWFNGLRGTWKKYKQHGHDAVSAHPYVKSVKEKLGAMQNRAPANIKTK